MVGLDENSTKAIYGRDLSNRAILGGEVHVPSSALPFIEAVRGAKNQAVASNQ